MMVIHGLLQIESRLKGSSVPWLLVMVEGPLGHNIMYVAKQLKYGYVEWSNRTAAGDLSPKRSCSCRTNL